MTDTLTVVHIDPGEVQRFASGVNKWKQIGEVQPRDWDLREKPLETSNKYRSILDRF